MSWWRMFLAEKELGWKKKYICQENVSAIKIGILIANI